jgi:hypothetical protein
VQFVVHHDWPIKNIGLEDSRCLAWFRTEAYKAKTGKLYPTILVMVKQADKNESLQDMLDKYAKKEDNLKPFIPSRCPAVRCISLVATQTGMYGKDGDGRARFIAFERNQPEFPGLIFEHPYEIPKSEGKEGLSYYRPNQTQQRIPGKLYYLILLDTAASIEEPAIKDLDFFLSNLTVE